MQIPWKLKSFLFHVIDVVDGSRLLYFAQKNLTRRSRLEIFDTEKYWLFHKANLEKLERPRVLEFGAGKNLAQNIFLNSTARHQTVVDLFPMFDADLANTAAKAIEAKTASAYFEISSVDDLSRYNISYIAPYDISQADFPDNSFDCCISTNTLEHIPRDSIIAIFTMMRRLLRNNGLISAAIDYSDHYSHTDRRIGPLEFLRYSDTEYYQYNHKSHFQNRLRHRDFEGIFKDLGYVILLSEPLEMAEPPSYIAPAFDASIPTTFATRGLFLLRNEK